MVPGFDVFAPFSTSSSQPSPNLPSQTVTRKSAETKNSSSKNPTKNKKGKNKVHCWSEYTTTPSYLHSSNLYVYVSLTVHLVMYLDFAPQVYTPHTSPLYRLLHPTGCSRLHDQHQRRLHHSQEQAQAESEGQFYKLYQTNPLAASPMFNAFLSKLPVSLTVIIIVLSPNMQTTPPCHLNCAFFSLLCPSPKLHFTRYFISFRTRLDASNCL